MKRKALAIVIAILLVVGVLAACTTTTTEESSAAASTEAAATEAATESESASADEGGSDLANADIVIGATYQDLQNEYIKQLEVIAIDYADQLGVQLITADGEGDPAKQVSQIDNFIAQGVNAIIMDPISAEGCQVGAQNAVDAGIPIIGLCAQISDQSILTSFVGSNDVYAGEIEMQKLADYLNGEGKIAIVEGVLGISAQIQRLEGNMNIIDENPGMEVVLQDTGNWSREETLTLVENWINSGTEFDAVCAHNDEMALGAYKALESAGLQDEIPVVGVDAIPDAVQSVADGGLLCTVLQDSTTQATVSLDAAIAAAKGEEVDKEYPVPFVLVDENNVADFMYIVENANA